MTNKSVNQNRTLPFRAAPALAVWVVVLCAVQPGHSQPLWIGNNGVSATTNWSDAANWSTGVPGASGNVIFTETNSATTQGEINNVVDSNFTIASLRYLNIINNNQFHTTFIPPGNTLSVGTLTVGGYTLNGSTSRADITGAGGTLKVGTGASTLTVDLTGAANASTGILDVSGLDNFLFNAGGAGGAINMGNTARSQGRLFLASVSNHLTVTTFNLGNNNTGGTSTIGLGGGTNIINVNTLQAGFAKCTGNIVFSNESGGLRLRNAAGTGRATITLGFRSNGGGNSSDCNGNMYLIGHPVDILAGTITLGQRTSTGGGSGIMRGRLAFDNGIVDATAINMGIGNAADVVGAHGWVAVGGSGKLEVGNISLVNFLNPSGSASGTLTITNGGTVNCAGNIVKTTLIGVGNIEIDAGTLNMGTGAKIGSAALPIDNMSLTNATLSLGTISTTTNVTVTNLTTGGTQNNIDIGLLPSITSYPVQFVLIKYQGAIAGEGYNFTATGLNPAFSGFLSNNAANSSVDLVITAGPIAQALTWKGNLSDDWDVLTTKNWAAGAIGTNYFDGDFVTFDDSGNPSVEVVVDVLPGSMTFNNGINYTITGSGGIGGLGGLTKNQPGTLTINNSGVNDFAGNIAINAGTVKVGNGGTSGSLGPGPLSNNGSLIFDRSNDLTVGNVISGTAAGTLTKNGAGVLTLGGANTFTGAVSVATGTLKTGTGTALGVTNGTTTIAAGASLDVNAQNLGAESVIVSGDGVGGNGAIINTGGQQLNALRYVTMANHTRFGNPGRWDIRAPVTSDPSGAALSTGGNAYNLTKVGTNQISLVGVTVDPALANIDIQAGILAMETATTSLGDPASTVTVQAGGTLQFFNTTNRVNKIIVLNGSGTNNTVNAGDGTIDHNFVIGPMTLNGTCLMSVNTADFMTFSNTITGLGSFVKVGAGTLTLAGPTKAYAGSTTVSNGTLVLNTLLVGGGTLTVRTNTTLSGTGTNLGPVVIEGVLAPGTSAGTLGSGDLTFSAGATATFELNNTTTIGGGVNDLVEVVGNINANNTTITVNLLGLELAVGTYRLFNYTGSLNGSFNPTVVLGGLGSSRYVLTLDTSTLGQVNLVVAGGPATVRWNSNSDQNWDIATTPNWFNLGTSQADTFFQADKVLFDDTAGVVTTVNIGVAVAPAVITNNSTANAFTIGAPGDAGKITGGAGIVKQGDSVLTLATTNDFNGAVTVEQGTLKVANSLALGSTAGGTTIKSGATLDLGSGLAANALNLGLEPVTVSGDGVGGGGAIINSSTVAQQNAVRLVTLLGHTTVGGDGRWDIRGAGATLSTGGNAYNIIKRGANQVSLVGVNVDATLADIDVQSGTFSIETSTTSAGNPNGKIMVQPSSTLQFFNLAVALNKNVAMTNANINIDSGSNAISGPVILDGGCSIDVDPGQALNFLGSVSGPSSLTKIENGTLLFSGPVSYTGDTAINAGTVSLVGSSSLATSPNITLGAGSVVLDVSARTDGTLSRGAAQSLSGNGTVLGSLTNNAGATLVPGGGFAVGALTVTNVVALLANSTNAMEVDKANLTNDVIHANTVVYGGRLQISSLGDPFGAGNSFKLFNASSYSGSFDAIEPAAPGAGLAWDTTGLTNGILRVISTTPLSPPEVQTFAFNGTDVTLAGGGGPAYGSYSVLTSTDLGLPAGSWTVLGTGNFDASGNFSINVVINPNDSRRFFQLRIP